MRSYPNVASISLPVPLPRERIGGLGRAVAAAREISDRRDEGAALGNLSHAHAHLGEMRRAIEHYEQQIKIAREFGDRSSESWALGKLEIA